MSDEHHGDPLGEVWAGEEALHPALLARIEALEAGVPSWLPADVMRRLQDAEGAVKELQRQVAVLQAEPKDNDDNWAINAD